MKHISEHNVKAVLLIQRLTLEAIMQEHKLSPETVKEIQNRMDNVEKMLLLLCVKVDPKWIPIGLIDEKAKKERLLLLINPYVERVGRFNPYNNKFLDVHNGGYVNPTHYIIIPTTRKNQHGI